MNRQAQQAQAREEATAAPTSGLCHHEGSRPRVLRALEFSREAVNPGLCGISSKKSHDF